MRKNPSTRISLIARAIALAALTATGGACAAPGAGELKAMGATETLPPKPAQDTSRDASHDFDFEHGRWNMQNRRLAKRLAGSREWIEYPSTSECHPLPGGIGNQDVYRTDYWPNFVGLTIRIYDPKSRQWSIYWIDNRNDYHGKLEAPVFGGFTGNIGIFEGPDEWDGKPVLVRYTWTFIDHDHAHFEQAFSPDGGQFWETNFMNDLTRVAE